MTLKPSNVASATTSTADDDLCFTPAVELSRLFRAHDLSPVELMQAVVRRSERLQPRVNCFVTLQAEQAMAQARKAEQKLMNTPAGELPALFGIPVTVKDTDDTAGVRTTYGSLHFADHVPEQDATIWARMKAAGAILLGKTTTPEFALSSVTESKLTGITNNPWNLAYSVAGSSGGAAAAAAAGLGPLATGSDGGGSIRAPSSFCGVVGLKGSPGRVPYNRRDSAWDNACVNGPITRTVADNAFMLDVIAGPDPYDAVSLPKSEISFLKSLRDPSMRGMRIAYCADLGNGPVDPEVTSVVSQAVARFASELGAIVEPVTIDLPDPYEYFISFWGPAITVMYEDMMLPMGHPEWLPDNIPDMVRRASMVDIARYARTIESGRSQIHAAFADIFAQYDYMIWPTSPVAPFPHPGPLGGPREVNGVRIEHPGLQNQRYTEAVSHAGYPAITVPAGFSKAGLPIGMQIAAGHFKDAEVLRAAAAFELVAPWAHLRPTC